jgi:hypothetical protein
MKTRNLWWIAVALLVVLAMPATAEEAAVASADGAACPATPAVETTEGVAATTEAVAETLPPMDFLGVGLCNCTVGNPCSIPCISADLTPTCVDKPCLSSSSAIDGVCVCL